MRKKSPTPIERKQWLEDYENGKSQDVLARENNRDVRTIKKGIEDARCERDMRLAKVDLLKEALRKHQNSLLEGLQVIVSTIAFPAEDYVPLSWYRGDNSVFPRVSPTQIEKQSKVSKTKMNANTQEGIVPELLREHLKGHKLWRVLGQWEKDYQAHLNDRKALQRKTVDIIETKTGYKMKDDKEGGSPPFLYSHNTGDFLLKPALHRVFLMRKIINLEKDLVADSDAGVVRYQGFALAKVPGNEENCRKSLLSAFNELVRLPEIHQVVRTYEMTAESARKAKEAAEELLLLGLIPGQCRVCRQLGM